MLTLCVAGWAVALVAIVTAGCLAVALRDERGHHAASRSLARSLDRELRRREGRL